MGNTLKHLSDYELDITSSKTLAESLKRYESDDDHHQKAKFSVLVNMCSKPMELARCMRTYVYLC